MPNVTAPSRMMGNGDVVTQFVDSVGTTTVTYTYPKTQEKLIIRNMGNTSLSVTVGSTTQTVVKNDKWEKVADFTTFTINALSGSTAFEAWADEKGSTFDTPEGQYFSGAAGASSLDTLTDVDVSTKTDGYPLVYNAATQKFKLQQVSASGSLATETLKQGVKNGKTLYAPPPATAKAMVTFIDDDAKVQVLTRIQPLVQSKSIPYSIAVPVNDINNQAGRSLTQAELLNLQDTLGCELVGHTYTHPSLSTLTTETQLEYELGESKEVLVAKGYKIKGVAYPFGASNDLVRKVASRYYNYGVSTLDTVNKKPIKSFLVDRVSLGAYLNVAGTADPLAYYKAKVDEAIANKGWVVFVTHCWHTDHNDTVQQQLSDLIDYVKAQSVSIVNLSDGYEAFGNLLEVEGVYRVTRERVRVADNDVTYPIVRDNTIANDALITAYKTQQITSSEWTNATKGTLPEAGLLETKRVPISGDYTYSTQTLFGITGAIYQRKATAYNDATWGAWATVYKASTGIPRYEYSFAGATLSANSFQTFTFSHPNASQIVGLTDTIIMSPQGGIEDGVLFTASMWSNKTIVLTLANHTGSSKTVAARIWNVTVIKGS